MVISLSLGFVGILIFLYLIWKRLKEDYSSENIFSLAVFVLAGMLLGYLASRFYFPKWWFWFEAFGAFLGFSYAVLKYNLRFFETFETVFIGLMPWLIIYYSNNLITCPTLVPILVTASVVVLLLLFWFIDSRYKNFSWYKSGRIGLAGLVTAAFFFLTRAAIATFFPFMVSFVGKSEVILSGVCAFTLFLLIYNLSKEEI